MAIITGPVWALDRLDLAHAVVSLTGA